MEEKLKDMQEGQKEGPGDEGALRTKESRDGRMGGDNPAQEGGGDREGQSSKKDLAAALRPESALTPGVRAGDAQKPGKEDFAAFIRAYPDVMASDIPREVWDAVRGGESLTSAYSRFEARSLREENRGLRERLGALEQRGRNREKSAGSQKSAGRATESQSWESAWYGDD